MRIYLLLLLGLSQSFTAHQHWTPLLQFVPQGDRDVSGQYQPSLTIDEQEDPVQTQNAEKDEDIEDAEEGSGSSDSEPAEDMEQRRSYPKRERRKPQTLT